MKRRSFLGSILAAATAPVFVPSTSLMKLPPPPRIWTPPSMSFDVGTMERSMVNLYSAAGVLLASIPMQDKVVTGEGCIHATVSMAGEAPVTQTGEVARVEFSAPYLLAPVDLTHSLSTSARHLFVGDSFRISDLRIT